LAEITYFESSGIENTDRTLQIARECAEEDGIRSVVVASNRGYTAEKASDLFEGFNLVVVTHVSGFREPNTQEFSSSLRGRLEARGVKVVTAAHAFSGVQRLVDGSIGEMITKTLRMFCEGFNVAVEIAAMAADAGLVRTDEDIVSVAGTGKGADTALVIRPAISRRLFSMKVKKILAKPVS
jgi:hypothetical protein